jgi:hypothetical protein
MRGHLSARKIRLRRERTRLQALLALLALLALTAAFGACTRDAVDCDDACPPGTRCVDGTCVPIYHPHPYYPQNIEKDVDLLLVVDNSASMGDEQKNLYNSIPALFNALKSPKLNNKIPNMHIGVVTTDLGAGDYALPACELAGGDRGKLQATPRVAGCVPPGKKPYIEYIDGVTNINNPKVLDPILKVTRALQCIVEVGTGGCGFEAQLEAARVALDPKLNRNPGFIRKDAHLAIAFLTDEDDCSAQKSQLFDPNQTQLTDPLGPLTSFRCFEFGVQCDCPGGACTRSTTGPRTNCKPAFSWLYKIDEYVSFFKGLKQPGRLILLAIAGPADKVEVALENQQPTLQPSCQTTAGKGRPAVRIKALLDGINRTGNKGFFNQGLDAAMTKLCEMLVRSYDPCVSCSVH